MLLPSTVRFASQRVKHPFLPSGLLRRENRENFLTLSSSATTEIGLSAVNHHHLLHLGGEYLQPAGDCNSSSGRQAPFRLDGPWRRGWLAGQISSGISIHGCAHDGVPLGRGSLVKDVLDLFLRHKTRAELRKKNGVPLSAETSAGAEPSASSLEADMRCACKWKASRIPLILRLIVWSRLSNCLGFQGYCLVGDYDL